MIRNGIDNQPLSKRELKTLNMVVDSLLRGKELCHVASCVIPKLGYILNLRLQDAINRGFLQTVQILQRNIEKLEEMSKQQIETQTEEFNKSIRSAIFEKTKHVTNSEINILIREKEKIYQEMELFYLNRKRKITEEYQRKKFAVDAKHKMKRKEIIDAYSYKKKHFQFSKAVEDKRALISIVTERSRILQENPDFYDSMSCSDAMINKHKKELKELILKEREAHEIKTAEEFEIKMDELDSYKKQVEQKIFNMYHYLADDNEKCRRRDILQILTTIEILKEVKEKRGRKKIPQSAHRVKRTPDIEKRAKKTPETERMKEMIRVNEIQETPNYKSILKTESFERTSIGPTQTVAFADMNMVTSCDECDLSECVSPVDEESEIEVSTTLSALLRHKFY